VTSSVESAAEHSYQIGTVATLTGLDPHTIRAWERRYGAIKPLRSETGRRRYDDRTVERLQLLKALVDCSQSIGRVAHLPDEDLRALLERIADLGDARTAPADTAPQAGPARLALIAPGLEAQLNANAVAFPELEVALSGRDPDGFLEQARRAAFEIVILELDEIGEGGLELVRACRDLPARPLVVVLYRFAQRAALARLARAGARLVQTPVRLEQLRRILHDQRMIEQARVRNPTASSENEAGSERPETARSLSESGATLPAAPPRRFDDDQLARLFEVSSGVDCECPNHLSSLVSALVSFERYSLSCESRNEADARLHQRLGVQTGQARALLEDLLADLCEHEGLSWVKPGPG